MTSHHHLCELAMTAAAPHLDLRRTHAIGAVALRPDGVVVSARNGSSPHPIGACHAEIRVLRKAGRGSVVYVARVRGQKLAYARPCPRCQAALRAKGIAEVVFSAGPNTWETLVP